MFEALEVEELDGEAAADALAETLQRIMTAEADQLRLAAHWADLHAPELVDRQLSVLPGTSRPVAAGADGTPRVDEFAAVELAALLGVSTGAGEQLVADAVNLRHRHPLLWSRICDGAVRVWLARKVARRCATAGLTAEQAMWVDAETTPFTGTLTPGRLLALVEAKIAAADPVAAAARAADEALRQFARAGQVDEHGMRTFVARAVAGDVTYLVAVLERIAGILAVHGDHRPVEPRMAEALRILANPARALRLLTEATLAGAPEDEADPLRHDEDRPDLVGSEQEQIHWMVDATGVPLPGVPLRRDLRTGVEEPGAGLPGGAGRAHQVIGGGEAPGLEEGLDPVLLEAVVRALDGFDSSRLDPVTVVHVHVAAEALESAAGVARVEDAGPMVLESARRWLSDRPGRLVLRPVVDARALAPVDRYEFTPLMREAVACRSPFEVFPYGTTSSRRGDLDHPRPYDPGGPPGQTGLHNCAPLGRRHHRVKTFGGWRLLNPEPGLYWWRTPHGHWFRVDRHGTHRHGRDPALDRSWLE